MFMYRHFPCIVSLFLISESVGGGGKINVAMLHWVQFDGSVNIFIFFYKPALFTLRPLYTLNFNIFVV